VKNGRVEVIVARRFYKAKRLKELKNGRVEELKNGRVEELKNGRDEELKNGRIEVYHYRYHG
jgi:acylphosphatase